VTICLAIASLSNLALLSEIQGWIPGLRRAHDPPHHRVTSAGTSAGAVY